MDFKKMTAALTILSTIPSMAFAALTPDAVLSSDNPADWALAVLLSEHLKSKTLTTVWGSLTNDTLQKLVEANASNVFLVGGDMAIPEAENSLSKIGISVYKRFNGSDRVETSALVAREWGNASIIFVAYAYDLPGISEVSEEAAKAQAPVLLIGKSNISENVKDTIAFLGPDKTVFLPSPDMDRDLIQEELMAIGPEVEIVLQDSKNKTNTMITFANSALKEAKESNFSVETLDEERDIAIMLIEESEQALKKAEGFYRTIRYDLAFSHAVLALYRAENSLKIKSGTLKITSNGQKNDKKPSKAIEIARILLNPSNYSEKRVVVEGKVEQAVHVNENAYVLLFDGTGRIFITFHADRETMISEGFIFMADPTVIGRKVLVEGVLHLNVPLGEQEGEHGAFAYLIEADNIRLAE